MYVINTIELSDACFMTVSVFMETPSMFSKEELRFNMNMILGMQYKPMTKLQCKSKS